MRPRFTFLVLNLLAGLVALGPLVLAQSQSAGKSQTQSAAKSAAQASQNTTTPAQKAPQPSATKPVQPKAPSSGQAKSRTTPTPPPKQVLPQKADPYHLKLPSTSKRLQALQQRLQAQKQLSAAQKQKLMSLQAALAALGTQQKVALDELDSLSEQIAQGQNRQQQLSTQVAQAKSDLQDTTLQLNVMSGQVKRLEEDVRQMLQSLYRQRSGQYLEVINQASSLSDLMIRTRYANIGGEHNVAVVEQLRLQRQDLETQRQKQQRQSEKLQALVRQQQSELKRLHAAQTEQQTVISHLRQTQAGKQALALQTRAQQELNAQNINQTIGQLIDERNAVERERRRRIEAERVRRAEELRRLREAQERARKEAARLAALRRAQAEAKARALAEARALAQSRARAQAQAAALARAQALARARSERAATIARERAQLQTRQNQLEHEQRQSLIELAPLPSASGPLGFPLPGGTVTQSFSDVSPWTVLQGSGVAVAALGGNVLAVTNYASLGWVVLIDHGQLITAYLGLSNTSVAVGQRVIQGTALGNIGGSPIFGEDHMAFQVNRVSGSGRTPVPPSF